jgi:hypothetical protein
MFIEQTDLHIKNTYFEFKIQFNFEGVYPVGKKIVVYTVTF